MSDTNQKPIKTIAIVGSCVARDSFEIGDKSKCVNDFKISCFYQNISPISLFSEKIEELQDLTVEDFADGTNWYRRLLRTDIQKSLYTDERLKAEYVMIDFVSLTLKIAILDKTKMLTGISAFAMNKEMLENKLQKKFSFKNTWDFDEKYLIQKIDLHINEILKIYKEEQIIYCKWFNANDYIVSGGGSIKTFAAEQNVSKKNDLLAKVYNYLDKKITNAHVIEMPKYAYADEGHKWGLYGFHFSKELYSYVLKCVDVITMNLDRNYERMILNNQKAECESQFMILRENIKLNNNVTKIKNKLQLEETKTKELNVKVDEFQNEINNIKKSKSFKIGRFFTAIPRKFRDIKQRDTKCE